MVSRGHSIGRRDSFSPVSSFCSRQNGAKQKSKCTEAETAPAANAVAAADFWSPVPVLVPEAAQFARAELADEPQSTGSRPICALET